VKLMMDNFESSRVLSSDGCPIAVWSGGNPDGQPVVLLHCFALDHTAWSSLAVQADLLDRCWLLVPDLRGHGVSGRSQDPQRYSDGRRWADDLAALLDLALDRDVAVVAWSFAGRMLLDYVRYHGPTRLRAINLVAAASVADVQSIGPDHACLNEMCAEEPALAEAAALRFLSAALGLKRGSVEFDHHMEVLRQTSPRQRAALRARPLDYDDLLAQLRLPVLVSHGDRDSIVLPRHAQRLGEVIPNASVSIYEGAGHAPFRDDPARFAAELTAFATRTSRDVVRQV
jgi:pimeloyl-ACP methyl ester carboxylesterase